MTAFGFVVLSPGPAVVRALCFCGTSPFVRIGSESNSKELSISGVDEIARSFAVNSRVNKKTRTRSKADTYDQHSELETHPCPHFDVIASP